MYYNELAGVEKARDGVIVCKTAAYDEAFLDKPRRVFGEKSLPRSKNPSAEDLPLTAVRVPRNGHTNIFVSYIFGIIFGVVAKKELITVK